jgi:hypothetical protein
VYTFAAPSPGDEGFATYYNQLFQDGSSMSTAFRLYNTLDVVPNAWASLETIKSYYVPAPQCTPEITMVIDVAQAMMGKICAQVGTVEAGSAIALPGTVMTPLLPAALLDIPTDKQFAWEVDYQHGTNTYLKLLDGAPIVPSLARLGNVLARLQQVAP